MKNYLKTVLCSRYMMKTIFMSLLPFASLSLSLLSYLYSTAYIEITAGN